MRLDIQTCGFHINSLDTNIDANVQSCYICKLLRHLCALVHDQSHKVFIKFDNLFIRLSIAILPKTTYHVASLYLLKSYCRNNK